MKNGKKPKNKPYKSLFSNIAWSIRKMLRYSPSAFFMQILNVPINIGLSYAAIYLPSLVVAVVTENRSLSYAAAAVGGLMLAILIGDTVK